MNQTKKIPLTRNRQPRAESGAALVIGLILLLVLTVLAISGMTTASLELQMAGNEQFQETAFQGAESGIEQAIDAGIYNTNTTIGNYTNLATLAAEPIAGTGQQIANCANIDTRSCEYFLRFDQTTGTTIVPGGGYSIGTGFQAYHFVVDGHGVAQRGASSEHTQSFYIIGPGGT